MLRQFEIEALMKSPADQEAPYGKSAEQTAIMMRKANNHECFNSSVNRLSSQEGTKQNRKELVASC